MVSDNLKVQLYAISLSGVIYGISLIALFELTSKLLKKRHKELLDIELSVFIITMFILGTAALAQGMFYLESSGSMFLTGIGVNTIASEELGSGGLNYFIRLGVPMSLPFTILGSNALMIGRLVGLGHKTHKDRSRLLFFVAVCFLCLTSLGGAIEFLIQAKLVNSNDTNQRAAIVPLASTITNVLLFLMSVRYLSSNDRHHQRRIARGVDKNAVRVHRVDRRPFRPYTSTEENDLMLVVFGISVDACILVAFLSVIHIVLSLSESPTDTKCMVTLQMFPQINVLSSIWAVERIVKEDQEVRRLEVDGHRKGTLPPPITQARGVPQRPRHGPPVESRGNVNQPVQIRLKSEWRPVVEKIQGGSPGLKPGTIDRFSPSGADLR